MMEKLVKSRLRMIADSFGDVGEGDVLLPKYSKGVLKTDGVDVLKN